MVSGLLSFFLDLLTGVTEKTSMGDSLADTFVAGFQFSVLSIPRQMLSESDEELQ